VVPVWSTTSKMRRFGLAEWANNGRAWTRARALFGAFEKSVFDY